MGKVVHTVKRAGTYAAKVPPQELHKIAVHVRAVVESIDLLLHSLKSLSLLEECRRFKRNSRYSRKRVVIAKGLQCEYFKIMARSLRQSTAQSHKSKIRK